MKTTPKKLKSKLHIDLQSDCLIRTNGELHLRNRHFSVHITTIEMVEEINKDYSELKEEKSTYDYEDHIWSLNRGMKLPYFTNHAEDILEFKGVSYYYKILGDVIIDIERPQNWKYEIIDLIYFSNQFKEMMNEDERKDFENLPDELVVYRGVLYNSEEVEDIYDLISCSWTLDYNVALFFTQLGNTKDRPIIFKYKVSKELVFSYFTRRKESEILLDFDQIDNDEVEIIYLEIK